MATTDSNIILVGSTPQNILLGSSTGFIIQNLSYIAVRYKVKDSIITDMGIINPNERVQFNYDITISASVPSEQIVTLYLLRD